MCPEHTKLYTECEHAITESYELTESTDLSSTQEIVRGRCPNCPDPPRSLMESSIEPLPTAPIVSYVRSLKGKAQRIVRSLRSTSSDDANTKEDRRSAQTVSMTSSTNMDDEIVGKENISARNSLADRTKVIVTGAISNAMAAKQPDDCQDTTVGGKEAEALAGEPTRAKMLSLADRIASNFQTMRENIDTANRRIADIDNFNLSKFMCQGVDRWTAAVKQAIQDCEDDLVRECKELARMPSDSSAA